MPLPLGTGQGMSPGTPAGDPFRPRKDHSKGPILVLKVLFLVLLRLLNPGDNTTPKKAVVHQKVRNFFFRGSFSFSGGPLELQGALNPLVPPWNKFWTRHCGHTRSARQP